MSGTIPWASSALITPMCANPRAAPPPSTRASLAPEGGAAGFSAKSAHADSRARSATRVARSMGVDRAMAEGNGPALPESRPGAAIVADSPPVYAPLRGRSYSGPALSAQAHVGLLADDEVVRVELQLDGGDAVLLLRPPARGRDGAGYELALGTEPRELGAYEFHADPELSRQRLDAPRGRVGRHELEHALA